MAGWRSATPTETVLAPNAATGRVTFRDPLPLRLRAGQGRAGARAGAAQPALCQFPAVSPWASPLISLNFPFICKADLSYSRVSTRKVLTNSSCVG